MDWANDDDDDETNHKSFVDNSQTEPILVKPDNMRAFNAEDTVELGEESEGTGFSDDEDEDEGEGDDGVMNESVRTMVRRLGRGAQPHRLLMTHLDRAVAQAMYDPRTRINFSDPRWGDGAS